MNKISGQFSRLAVWSLLMALLAACGSKSATTAVTSTSTPLIFSVQSVAINNGKLFDWGGNTYGQLGNGIASSINQLFPSQVLTLADVAGVSAGGTHTLAFRGDGTAWAWGNNWFGQLGNGFQNLCTSPTQVILSATVTAVAAGANHSLARDATGQLWAWGDNTYGQLGDGTTNFHTTPVLVQLSGAAPPSQLTLVTKIAAGGGHSLAISDAGAPGTVYAWGYNGNGQLGQPSANTANQAAAVPVTIASGGNLQNVIDIAAGGGHSLFVTGDGKVWACGFNNEGQLGVGDTLDRNVGVVQVTVPAGAIQVAAGLDHSLAIIDDGSGQKKGTVWAWGYNFSGQLGTGEATLNNNPHPTPAQVKRFDNAPLTNIKKIVTIGNHSLAVDDTGQLWAWGDNTSGQLGSPGIINNSNLAVRVSLPTGSDLYHP